MKVTSSNKSLVSSTILRLYDRTRNGRLKWQFLGSKGGINRFNAAVPGGGRVEVLVPPSGPETASVRLFGLGEEDDDGSIEAYTGDGVNASLLARTVVERTVLGGPEWLQKMYDALA